MKTMTKVVSSSLLTPPASMKKMQRQMPDAASLSSLLTSSATLTSESKGSNYIQGTNLTFILPSTGLRKDSHFDFFFVPTEQVPSCSCILKTSGTSSIIDYNNNSFKTASMSSTVDNNLTKLCLVWDSGNFKIFKLVGSVTLT